jgi:EKC/KEOPS complex subunit CGI121/TPRKB
METYTLDHFPSSVQAVHVAVFHNLRNAPEIRKRLIAAATAQGPEGDLAREEVDFGFIEGNMVRTLPPTNLPYSVQRICT